MVNLNFNNFSTPEIRNYLSYIDSKRVLRDYLPKSLNEIIIEEFTSNYEVIQIYDFKFPSLQQEIKNRFLNLLSEYSTLLSGIQNLDDTSYMQGHTNFLTQFRLLTEKFNGFRDAFASLDKNVREIPQIQSKLSILTDLENEIQKKKKSLNSIEETKQQIEEQKRTFSEIEGVFKSRLEEFDKSFADVFTKASYLKNEEIFVKEINRLIKENKFYRWVILTSLLFIIGTLLVFISDICSSCLFYLDANYSNQLIPKSHIFTTLVYGMTKGVILRLCLIGVAIYILNFSTKIYRANLHNISINNEKLNSLAVSRNLVGLTTNEVIQKDILCRVSDSIFQHHETGYLTPTKFDKKGISDFKQILKDLNSISNSEQ